MDRQYDNNVVNTADVIISAYADGYRNGKKRGANTVLTTTGLLIAGGTLLLALYSRLTEKKTVDSSSTETESK